MKKRMLSMLLALVMVVGLVPSFTLTASAADGTTWDGSSVATDYAGGTGTEADPYRIETAGQLIYFRDQVNKGKSYSGKYFRLDADLDMNNKTFGNAIGTNSNNSTSRYFNGNFDGNHHTISNLEIGNSNYGYSALFGNVGFGGQEIVIKNLTLVNVNVNRTNTNWGAAALVGQARYAKIENCTVESGTVTTAAYSAAGLVADLNYNNTPYGLTIINCVNKANVKNTSTDSGPYTGGIVGSSPRAKITGCTNYGTITTNNYYVGGIAGKAGSSTIEKCANYGEVSSVNGSASGILADGGNAVIKNCYNRGNITAKKYATGIFGLYGSTSGRTDTIVNCYSVGTLTGSSKTHAISIRGNYPDNCTLNNNYSLTAEDEYVTQKTAEEFADGTVCGLLQAANTEQVWEQTIGTDSYPVFYNGSNTPSPSHTHNWTYALEEGTTDTLKATCGNEDGNCPDTTGGSVTIAAPDSLVYTGDAIEAKVTNTLTTDDTVTVVYTPADKLTDGKPVNAGVYTASITIGDQTASVDYIIAKADATAPTDLTAVYGQTLANVSLPNGWTWVDSTANVGDVGTRTHKANYAGDDNHKEASNVDVTVTVSQSGSTMTATANQSKYTYGETVKITVTGITPTGIAPIGLFSLAIPTTNQVAIWNGDTQLTEPQIVTGSALTFDVTGLTVGNYTLTAKFTGNDNMAATSCDVSVSIEQAEPDVTAPTGLTATYGDTLADVTLPTVNNGAWIWETPADSVGNVGTQKHKATFTPTDTNYKAITVDAEVVVEKATIDSVSFSVTAPEAGETPQSTVTDGTGYTAAIAWYPADSTFGFNTAYTATVKLTADSNHKFADDISVDDWYKSADGNVLTFVKTFAKTRKANLTELTDKPTDKTLTAYHANANSAIAELPTTVTYQTESGNVTVDIEWSCGSYNSATEATNTFAWTVKSGELSNYDGNNIDTTGSITVTNVAALPVTNTGNDTEITYDGNTFDVSTMFTKDTNAGEASYEIVVRGTEGEGTASLGADGKTLTITKAGVITIKMNTAANGAYAAGSATATLTVKKADAAVTTAPTANNLTDTGSAQALVTAGEAKGGTMVYSLTEDGTYTEAIPTGTNAGKYTVWYYVIGDDNHADSAKAFVEVTIAKAYSFSGGSGSTAYTITVKDSEKGDVTANRKTASKGTTVTIAVTPDAGYTLETLSVTDKNGNAVTLTDNGDGTYSFKMPASNVTVKATFMDDNTMLNFFVDVSAEDYYYDAVLWAVKNGITGGIGNSLFAPDASCTRAQIVTFLWRAAGCPEPKTASSFTDVSADAYYAKAVAWAVENGITGGIGNNQFAPDLTCTRAQAVAFLFRYAASQGMDAVTLQELVSGYGDAAQVPGYALPAFNWALAQDVVQGYSGNLMPNNDCTRAQIVTMLYRLLGE